MPRGKTAPAPKSGDTYIWNSEKPAQMAGFSVQRGDVIDTSGWTGNAVANYLRMGLIASGESHGK